MKRALVFAHYDKDDMIDPYVIHALTVYRQYFDLVVFVSVSKINDYEKQKLFFLADIVIARENYGYDFGSWRVGFEALQSCRDFDEIVFANDSCYGPITDFGSFLERSELIEADIWGATISHQFCPHVQSYFMAFRRRVLNSGFASQFWKSIEHKSDKTEIIWEYEIGLSQKATAEGYMIGAVAEIGGDQSAFLASTIAEYNQISNRLLYLSDFTEALPSVNPNQFYWLKSALLGNPFVKIELLRDNPPNIPLESVAKIMKTGKRFHVSMVDQHLRRVQPEAKWFLRETMKNIAV